MLNKRAKHIIIKTALMCSISGAGFYVGMQTQPHSEIAYAKSVYKTTTITSMRRGMSNNEKLIVKIPSNQPVDVKTVYKNGAWAKVDWNNKTGYIRTMYLEQSKDSGSSTSSSSKGSTKKGASYQSDGFHMYTVDSVSLRKSASANSKKIETVKKGTDFVLIDQSGSYYKIYINNKYGWIPIKSAANYKKNTLSQSNTTTNSSSQSNKKLSGASPGSSAPAESRKSLQRDGYHMVTTANVAFRSSNSANSKKLGTLPKASDLLMIDRKGDWYKVYANQRYGYVHKNYLADYGTSRANKALSGSNTSNGSSSSNSSSSNSSSSNSSSNNSSSSNSSSSNNSSSNKSSNSSSGESLRSDGYHMYAKAQTLLKKGAGSNYKTRGTLSKGSDVLIIDQKGSWYKVYYNKAYSWVKKSDLADYKKGSSGTTSSSSSGSTSSSSSSNKGSSGTFSQSLKKTGGTRSRHVKINNMGSYKNTNIKISGSVSGTNPSQVSIFLNDSYLNKAQISGKRFTYTIPSNITKPGTNQLRVQVSTSDGLIYQTESFKVSKKPTILVDPGHGGRDPGAIGKLNGKDIYEKDYAIKFATNLSNELKGLGFKVDMSRTGDQTLHRTKRLASVHQSNPDLFFSVHHNAAQKSASGALTLYPSAKVNPSTQAVFSESKTIAQMLGKAYASSGMHYRGAYQDKDISGGSLYMLRNTNTRSILTEIGFITNGKDLKKIMNPSFQQNLPKQMAKQVHHFFYK